MTTTLIFDLDGLLADTEKLHRMAYQQVLADVGIAIPDGEYEEHWIRQGKGIREYVASHGLAVDPNDLRSRKAIRYKELVFSMAEPMPGALEVLRSFHGRKTLALATSSYRDAALTVLAKLQIKEYFACIAASADAERSKPFPDIFLYVAKVLHVSPSECLVIEDSEKGILAATAAGMLSVAVPNVHTAHNDFSSASIVLPSLLGLTLEVIDGLGR